MGNTSTKWMTLYRHEQKSHQAEINKLISDYDNQLLAEKLKNEWLNNKLVEAQHKVRVLTQEIARKEEQIDDLQKHLRRTQKLGRGFKKKTLVEASVPSCDGGGSRYSGEHNLSV